MHSHKPIYYAVQQRMQK